MHSICTEYEFSFSTSYAASLMSIGPLTFGVRTITTMTPPQTGRVEQYASFDCCCWPPFGGAMNRGRRHALPDAPKAYRSYLRDAFTVRAPNPCASTACRAPRRTGFDETGCVRFVPREMSFPSVPRTPENAKWRARNPHGVPDDAQKKDAAESILTLEWIGPLSDSTARTLPVILRRGFHHVHIFIRVMSVSKLSWSYMVITRSKTGMSWKTDVRQWMFYMRQVFSNEPIHSNIEAKNTTLIFLNINYLCCTLIRRRNTNRCSVILNGACRSVESKNRIVRIISFYQIVDLI